MRLLRRWMLIFLTVLVFFSAASAEPYEHPYPDELKITINTETWTSDTHGDVAVSVPETMLDSINTSLRDSVAALFALAETHTDCRIDMAATYRVSGTAWAGFLLTGRAMRQEGDADRQSDDVTAALYFDVQTYNMNTGAPLTLYDIFPEDSAAWAMIRDAAQAMLAGTYPDEPRNEDALAEMLAPEALGNAPFLPCAGQLMVPFALEKILPNHPQIKYLILPYPDYRPMMFPFAQRQTDNSSRPMIALTFDDGPSGSYTPVVLQSLASYGASATFFCIGNLVSKYPDIVRRETEYGHTVAAHSMTHVYPWEQPADEMRAEFEQQKQLYRNLTGFEVTFLRPPGGDLKTYVLRQIGWPLIRWNKSGSDTGNDGATVIANRIIRNAEDGDIVLNHDIKRKTSAALPLILETLTERGFMFATVDELLYLHGVTPQPNVSYYDGFGIKTYPEQ